MTALEALAKLKEGNGRFVVNVRGIESIQSTLRRAELAAVQKPFAVVLGCSDSRVPAELVFDQGLGDLFVIRVAGNIVAPSQLGSIEFAVERFGVSLVVVLGHSKCGAIDATLDVVRAHPKASASLSSIVERIRPALEPLVDSNPNASRESLISAAVHANVLASVSHVRHGTAVIEDLVLANKLTVVGAEYDLETGKVAFIDA